LEASANFKIAEQLSKVGAVVVVAEEHLAQQNFNQLINSFISDYAQMAAMTNIAKNLVDGHGAEYTALKMMA
jgi:UDP-N-acetylglucosamine:LPS N-acetylglucosamine transferase